MLERAEPRGLVACHSPSNRQLKGTAAIERVTRGTGWELDVVEDVSHAEVLERKHEAALVIDQFGDPPHPDGIGVSAIEAMAMGLPVIGRASRPVRALYRERLCPAVLIEGVVEFQAELAALAVNEERRQALGEDGRAWVARFHGSGRALEDLEALGACTELVAA
ncbi:MAG: glycosyltransferase [Nitriliruptoraceae bacterium]